MSALCVLTGMIIVLISSTTAQPKLPGIGYLGMGYDVVYGNPIALPDNGLRVPVVNFTYYEGNTVWYENYLIPDYTVGYVQPPCQKFDNCDIKAHVITNDTGYASLIYESIDGFDRSLFANTAFSASPAFQKIKASTGKGDKFTFTNSKCSMWTVEINLDFMGNLTDHFIESAQSLPLTINVSDPSDPYFKFIEVFGTSYSNSINLGVEYIREYDFSDESWNRIEIEMDITTVAFAEYEMGIGCNVSNATLILQVQEFESTASAAQFVELGGSSGPNNCNATTWQNRYKI